MCYFNGLMDENRGRATRCDVAWTARILFVCVQVSRSTADLLSRTRIYVLAWRVPMHRMASALPLRVTPRSLPHGNEMIVINQYRKDENTQCQWGDRTSRAMRSAWKDV